MSTIHLPHISRVFSAPFVKQVWRGFVLNALLCLILLTIYSILYPEQEMLRNAKNRVLMEPYSSESHTNLGSTYEAFGAVSLAKEEYKTAQYLAVKEQNQRVLGASTIALSSLKNEPTRLLSQRNAWIGIIKQYPGYRDAYLQLGALYYQLKNIDRAEEAVNKAIEIDPNSEVGQRLKTIIDDKTMESGK